MELQLPSAAVAGSFSDRSRPKAMELSSDSRLLVDGNIPFGLSRDSSRTLFYCWCFS